MIIIIKFINIIILIIDGRYIEVSDYSVLHLANAPVMETGLTTNRPKK